MKPLETLTRDEVLRCQILLFDLDDTVLTHGELTLQAYEALWSLRRRSLMKLVAITGRPGGWGEVLARQWPLDAVIAENGAVYYQKIGRHVSSRCLVPVSAQRESIRFSELLSSVRQNVPTVPLADDNLLRRTDMTFDIGESYQATEGELSMLARTVRLSGAVTLRSSIHLHAMYHRYDKASGALAFLREIFRLQAGEAQASCLFVGDSENDASCFSLFQTTVAVANVSSSLHRLPRAPVYVTSKCHGEGFAELTEHLLSVR